MNATANLHWYLLFAASWAALWRPSDRGDVVAASAVLFVAAASDPFTILVAPVLALQFLRDRRRSDIWRAAALLAGLAIQAGVVLFNDQPRSLDPTSAHIGALFQWYANHVVMTAVFGISIRDWLLETLGTLPTAALAVAILSGVLVPALRSLRGSLFIPGALIGLHLAFYFLPVVLAGTSTPRYAVTPVLLLYSLIAWGFVTSHVRYMRYLAGATTILLTAIVVADFGRWNVRADGPSWTQELARGRAACEAGRGSAVIAVPPRATERADAGEDSERGWSVLIPCDRLSLL
jgi:hypothetical protein